jgi:hypothetical protein
VELDGYKERYEIEQPVVSAHNLILGTMYFDLGGKSIIKNLSRPDEVCVLEFHKKGWTASSAYKINGEILRGKKEVLYKLEGKWSEGMALIPNVKGAARE